MKGLIPMFTNHWKHLAVAGLVASAFFCGANAWQPVTVEAAPFVYIDQSDNTVWLVDKGSIKGEGTSSSPLQIYAEKDADYGNGPTEAITGRYYQFKQVNGVWKYRYYGYTGKGSKIPYTSWNNVSGHQLANDILYIALN